MFSTTILIPVTESGAILLLNHSVPQKEKEKKNAHQYLKKKAKIDKERSKQSLAEGVPRVG